MNWIAVDTERPLVLHSGISPEDGNEPDGVIVVSMRDDHVVNSDVALSLSVVKLTARNHVRRVE